MDLFAISQLLIYLVLVLSMFAYIILDGFDLGVGCLHLLARGDLHRRVMINAIGPVWDGNATWIVIGGGVLFAGFPKAFSIIFSHLYLPSMALLFGFMMRGMAIEFRSKRSSMVWRNTWDFFFFFSSLILALVVGLLLGNLIQGLPLNEKGEFFLPLSALVRPYPVLITLFGLSLFALHGSLYLLMKTEGEIRDRFRRWVKPLLLLFSFFWLLATLSTWIHTPHMVQPMVDHPFLFLFPLLSIAAIVSIPIAVRRGNDGWAFLFSCSAIFFLLLLFVIGTFPKILPSMPNPQYSLTAFNSSASQKTLLFLLIIAGTGIPLSFFYVSYIYKVFRGKIHIDSTSY